MFVFVLQSEVLLLPKGFAHPKIDRLSEEPVEFKLMLELTEFGVITEPTEQFEFLRELPGMIALGLCILFILLLRISCGIFGAPMTPVLKAVCMATHSFPKKSVLILAIEVLLGVAVNMPLTSWDWKRVNGLTAMGSETPQIELSSFSVGEEIEKTFVSLDKLSLCAFVELCSSKTLDL